MYEKIKDQKEQEYIHKAETDQTQIINEEELEELIKVSFNKSLFKYRRKLHSKLMQRKNGATI